MRAKHTHTSVTRSHLEAGRDVLQGSHHRQYRYHCLPCLWNWVRPPLGMWGYCFQGSKCKQDSPYSQRKQIRRHLQQNPHKSTNCPFSTSTSTSVRQIIIFLLRLQSQLSYNYYYSATHRTLNESDASESIT